MRFSIGDIVCEVSYYIILDIDNNNQYLIKFIDSDSNNSWFYYTRCLNDTLITDVFRDEI